MSNFASNRILAGSGEAEVVQAPNMLRLKVGSRFNGLNAGAVAKAEAALKSLSSQFSQWLQDEIDKLEAARAAIREQGLNRETADKLYTHAHDLKGLGGTYGFPIITRIAASLCRLLETPDQRLGAPLILVDAHIQAIRAAVRDDIRDDANPQGKGLVDELERQAFDYIAADRGSATKP